jgi:pimeloyl-ACP methyl ester carboxylesterase
MQQVDKAAVSSRSQADKILAQVESSLPVRQFLLTNMMSEADGNGKISLRFRLPLDLLSEEILNVGDFPYTPPPPVSPTSPQWTGPTVFIKGSRSKYINNQNIPVCQAFFPNSRIETLEAGHWVHSERPLETVEIVAKLIKEGK